MMNLTRIPAEEDLFDWLFENFRHWPPIKDQVKAINRAAHGHPTRTFDYLWSLIEEEIAFHCFE
eukprot:5996095-Karenia_brevis.AAC.1